MVRYHNSYYEPHVRKAWWVQPEISGGGEMMNELAHQVNTGVFTHWGKRE